MSAAYWANKVKWWLKENTWQITTFSVVSLQILIKVYT
jgi:hypothetical protein